MSDTIDVQLKGANELIHSIKDIAIASPGAVQRGVKRVAFKIERDAKGGVPVATGRLRASITTNWTGSGMDRADIKDPAKESKPEDAVGQPPNRGKDSFTAVVGSNLDYADDVEWNETANHPNGGSAHYLYSAYFRNEDEVPKEISSELGKELAKAMRK